MNTIKGLIFTSALMTAAAVSAQNNGDITISHEVVPEEQAATRLRLNPVVSLPKVTLGRIPAATSFTRGELTPSIYTLDPAAFACSLNRYPWRGYAALGYGPVYNLAASAGYRFIEKETLTLDAYMQFNGMNHKSGYPTLEELYPGKERFKRNTGLIGSNLSWHANASDILTASVLYQYSAYNYPILNLGTRIVTPHDINANLLKVDTKWSATINAIDYTIGADYSMVAFSKNEAENRGKIKASAIWHASSMSAWGADLAFSLSHSTIIGNKGILHVAPYYTFSADKFTAKVGGDIDIHTGNVGYKRMLIAPEAVITWQALPFAEIWGKVSGRLDENSRVALYDEQPYLLPCFDAGYSRIYDVDGGLTIGPWRGAAISLFIGHTNAKDWYMPAVETGYMTPIDMKGLHGGVAFSYDYRRYLSVDVRAELAQSPNSNYAKGYALWRDHAGFNLTANATVRPIQKLSIGLGYQLRTHRSKMLANGHNLNLLNISNLKATATYQLSEQWSAFLSGENMLNNKWYLCPSVPSQGIVGMIGATYKF